MSTALVTGERFLDHLTGPTHPERPERLTACWRALREAGLWDRFDHLVPRAATRKELERVHTPDYLDRLAVRCAAGGGWLDPDTPVCPDSYEVACLSAGAGLVAVEKVLAGEASRALVLARPPGHHALADCAMGFCLLNNVALAAHFALVAGLERVFILDWDVHHGNGTQDAFYADPRVFFCSLHQQHHWPGTGPASERGAGRGQGATLNLPVPAGTGDAEYLRLVERVVAPAVLAFEPELLLVSCGFDAHGDDPLGELALSEQCFGDLARQACAWAAECCAGRLVMLLEGGYDLPSLGQSTVRVASALLAAGGQALC